MANRSLVPCLVSLRGEFNILSPERSKASDGWIGDTAHQQTKSDHNPDARGLVHAIDVDKDLNLPGWSMDRVVQLIVTRHRSGLDNRLQYVIHNRRIWSRSWGWQARAYTGPNPHDKHAHFSARDLVALENNTAPWGLLAAHLGGRMSTLDADDKKWLLDNLGPAKVWSYDIDSSAATYSAGGGVWVALQRAGSLANKQMPALTGAVSELAKRQIDPEALIAALVPALSDAVAAKLPQVDVTAEELRDAILQAARELVA